MEEKLEKELAALAEFRALSNREIHPEGEFDKAGRWYPSDYERCDCCDSIRAPSRAYPYSYMVHCRTLKHVCCKYGVDERTVRNLAKGQIARQQREQKEASL